jgi:hypothetical protein
MTRRERIVVPVEGEGVLGVEPAEVASAALVTASDGDHRGILVITTI